MLTVSPCWSRSRCIFSRAFFSRVRSSKPCEVYGWVKMAGRVRDRDILKKNNVARTDVVSKRDGRTSRLVHVLV
jgi:hypothetical protein